MNNEDKIKLCIQEFEVYSNQVGEVITEYHWRGANECILLLKSLLNESVKEGPSFHFGDRAEIRSLPNPKHEHIDNLENWLKIK